MKKFIGVCALILFSVSMIFRIPIKNTEPEILVTIIEEAVVLSDISIEEPTENEETKPYKPVITKCKDEESADYIWNELSKYSPSDVITAGIMGYFWRESNFRSNAVAGWHVRNIGRERDICEEFTEIVDAGLHDGSSKEYFIEKVSVNYGGYGLGQWLSLGYLEHFYGFIRERGGSIGDAALQCEFIFESIKQNEELWQMLLECETAAQTGRRIGIWYDGATSEGIEYIASCAHKFYKDYNK